MATTLSAALFSLFLCTFTGMVHAARLALVVGNDGYRGEVPVLKNARNDARLMTKTLRQMGFDVTSVENADRPSLWGAIDRFKSHVQKGDDVVFYFSGHGVQIGASPVLLPIDIQAQSDSQVQRDGVPLIDVQEALSKARFALLVIDACRDNPFPKRGTRSIGETRGLAPIEAADGMAIIMAASRNQKALDSVPGSSAENGLFTHEFVREIQLPGVDIQTALRRVRDRVETQAARVNNSQRPSLIDETRGSFYFVPGGVAVVRPADVRAEPIVAPARPEPIIAPARPASFSTTGYSKISNNGDLLPESATLGTGANDWACTRDNAKGLMWEVNAAAGMRAMEHTYSWYDSNSKDGSKGTAHGGKCHRKGRCDTEKFVQDVNALGLCGRRDWRMPAIEELKGLEKNSWEPPLIGPVYFPNTPSAHVWSGSPQPGASNGASGVVFSNPGYTYYDVRSKSYSVRLVRSGQ